MPRKMQKAAKRLDEPERTELDAGLDRIYREYGSNLGQFIADARVAFERNQTSEHKVQSARCGETQHPERQA